MKINVNRCSIRVENRLPESLLPESLLPENRQRKSVPLVCGIIKRMDYVKAVSKNGVGKEQGEIKKQVSVNRFIFQSTYSIPYRNVPIL